MLKNFITIAFRHLKRNFVYSLINILGLALGLAGSYVIGNWVWQELSFDKHFKDSERIYRVSVSFYSSGAFSSGPEILNNTLNDIAPEVELTARLHKDSQVPVFIGNEKFEENIFHADSTFFKLFSYDFLFGNPETALSNSSQVVIDTQLAQKFFGSMDVIGETIEIGKDKIPYVISGVVKHSKLPSHINARIWLSIELEDNQNWTSAWTYNYVKLYPQASKSDLVNRLEAIKKDIVYPWFETEVPYDEWKNLDFYDFHVVALEDIHLDPDMRFEMQPGGNRANVIIFTIVAIFLLVIAAINFINLSTAQSLRRANEVAIRKTFGIFRYQLIVQFLIEAIIVSLIAMTAGFGLSELFLILFQSTTNEILISGIFQTPIRLIFYILISILVGTMAGFYPAFYLSRYRPGSLIKSAHSQNDNKGFRNILVVVQFTVSIALIIGSLLVYRQLEYLKNVDLGFDRENVLIINNASALGNHKESFRSAVLSLSGVENASFNKRMPAGNSVWIYSFKSEKMDNDLAFQTFIGDDRFIPTMGFKLLQGRNFNSQIASDSTAVILNESAVKEMLLTDPVGASLQDGYKVIGVISDFGYQSFQEKPGPIVLLHDPDGYRLSIKIKQGNTATVLSEVREKWNEYSSDKAMNYSFLDQNLEKLMDKEKTLGKTVSFFTVIAIFVSCLGLFGLAAYTAEQRKKEIGIRKVLGARILDVVLLLNGNYTRQIAIALVVAIPFAWLLIDRWLQNFAYKMIINPWVFVLSGLLALLIAWTTVSYLSLKSAMANPVDSIRQE